jgi:D-alanyl-D-alanine carboxypeptidase
MQSASGVTAILGRIGAITERFGGSAEGGGFTILQTEEFDPFGDEYQAAVDAMSSGPSVAGGAFSQQYGGAFGLQSMNGLGGMPGLSGTAGGTPPPPTPLTTASVQLAISGLAGPAGQRPTGGYGTLPVPADLAAYGNGRVPGSALTPIGQGGHRLFAPAAASWQNVVAAARADGIELRITDSYRSYDEQVDLADRKGLYQNGGLAAVPGTSVHGWGMAVDADVRDERTLQWLRVNGPRFGWVETTPREPWHWEFRPTQV